jgi:hypothetical protein
MHTRGSGLAGAWSWLQEDFDGSVGLLLEQAVGVGRLGEGQMVGGEAIDAKGIE